MALTVQAAQSLQEKLRLSLRGKYGKPSDAKALLMDISGSMGGDPIVRLREMASEFTEFRRFVFSDGCQELKDKAIPEPHGTTAMHTAFTHVKLHGIDHVVLITDGRPDDENRALLCAQGLKLDILYVGPDPAPGFLERLAKATGGSYGKADLARVKELSAAVRERLAIAGAVAL